MHVHIRILSTRSAENSAQQNRKDMINLSEHYSELMITHQHTKRQITVCDNGIIKLYFMLHN